MKATGFAFSTPRSKRSGSGGFTLTELLVTIVIIVVLAALIFSVSSRMKNSAAKTKEMVNMKSISNLVLIFHSDNGILPGKPSSGATGGLNRGVVIPSRSNVAMENSLSTYLISRGYVGGINSYKSGVDDDLWMTSGAKKDKKNIVSLMLNSGTGSEPMRFFGAKQGTPANPLSIAALKKNNKERVLPDGVTAQDLNQLWMLSTADEDNYPEGSLISTGVTGNSEWKGRFYSFFDGHVDFIKDQTPSIYPEDLK